jgi:subtilisin family serine protease
MTFKHCAAIIVLAFSATLLNGQAKKAPENWFTLDPTSDKVNGTGSDQALKTLKAKGKKGQTIIVAVLDSGIDVDHEDLKEIMWVNPGEIAGNGIDDDGNGYVDDIHGWNFLGGKDGKNVHHETLELTREYVRLSKRFKGTDPKNLLGPVKEEYKYYEKVKTAFEEQRAEAEEGKARIEGQLQKVEDAFVSVEKAIGKKDFTAEELSKVDAGTNADLKQAIQLVQAVMSQGIESRADLEEQKKEATAYFDGQLNYNLNPDYNPRDIVGDNPDDLSNRYYGSNDYQGPDAFHGTHVAGIIAAVRNNGKGINGIADNVRIMTVRCVPDGDERDKDVANAIYYAVDNGASIINMSFGKGYSPQKAYVDAAMQYAAEHDVLLIHAAGNDAENNDTDPNFPNDNYIKPVKAGLFKKDKTVPTWMEIGALSWKAGENRLASFSNYGKKNVDLFSPGHQLYSTVPGNEYKNASGTSMAAPAAAGVAAIIRSYYPELSAKQVKDIMVKSVAKQDGEVYEPGTTEKVAFTEICVSGGIVSATNAVAMAEQAKGKKVKKAIWRDAGVGKATKFKKAKAATP